RRSADRPQKLNAPPPAWARSARPPLRRTSPAPAAALSSETSSRERDTTAALRSHAATPPHLPPESASTTASPPVTHAQELGRIHHPSSSLFTRASTPPAQFLLAHPRPPQSDLLSEILLRGHFYRGQKGTLSSRYNSLEKGGETFCRTKTFVSRRISATLCGLLAESSASKRSQRKLKRTNAASGR